MLATVLRALDIRAKLWLVLSIISCKSLFVI